LVVRPDHVARVSVPQATEWQRIGNEIDAAMIFCAGGFRKGVVS
jgi:hypothetical protein